MQQRTYTNFSNPPEQTRTTAQQHLRSVPPMAQQQGTSKASGQHTGSGGRAPQLHRMFGTIRKSSRTPHLLHMRKQNNRVPTLQNMRGYAVLSLPASTGRNPATNAQNAQPHRWAALSGLPQTDHKDPTKATRRPRGIHYKARRSHICSNATAAPGHHAEHHNSIHQIE